VGELARVRRDNVLAPDLERLAHERDEHGEEHAFELDVTESREMEGLEDTLGRMGSAHTQTTQRNGGLREEALLDALESRLAALESQVGLVV
jgi:hypothetical protein